MKITKIDKDIFEISSSTICSNIYFLPKKSMLIDLGSRQEKNNLIAALKEIGHSPSEIKKVIFTHFHYDHTGSSSTFKNAKFYASAEEIKEFKSDPIGTTLNQEAAEELKKIQLIPLKEEIDNLKVIKTPGHTAGSICLYHKEKQILFSGDTIFEVGIGRTDLPTSKPELLQPSIEKLKKYKIKILCAGH